MSHIYNVWGLRGRMSYIAHMRQAPYTRSLIFVHVRRAQDKRHVQIERPVSHVFNPVQVRHVANTTTHLTGLVRCRHCNRLFNRALLQKRPTILRSLLFEATLYLSMNHTHTTQCTVQKEYRREVGGWGRDPKKCTGRGWGMGSSSI